MAARPPVAVIACRARLLRPAEKAAWLFVVLPAAASAKLPTRSALTVEGRINGHAFRAVLQPDGARSHWLKVTPAMHRGAGAAPGDVVTLEFSPSGKPIEASVPPDLRRALAATPAALAVWKDITPVARRDWILWITSAKQETTRARRIASACDMLGSGKRRVCCFDRSGFYSKGLSAPRAAAG